MLIAASSTPADFPSVEPDFGKLLDHVVLRDYGQTTSLPRKSTCNEAPVASVAEPAPPSEDTANEPAAVAPPPAQLPAP